MFKKIIYSGICLCSHSYEDHHLGIILNPDALKVMGPYLPQECEFFGSNEDGGLDENGQSHCHHYVDVNNPDEEMKKQWRATYE